jgi:hypothetical protein
MTRRTLAIALPVLAVFTIAARQPDNPKHENHYKPLNTIAAPGATITLNGAQSQQAFLKVDGKITNTTGDTLYILRKEQAEFALPTGNVAVKAPTLFGGPMVIPPGEKGSYTWASADGSTNYHVDRFALNVTGLYSAPNAGTKIAGPEFVLPPSTNTFTAGPFDCSLTKHFQDTQNTNAEFQCSYHGTGVGFIDARTISARAQSGKEFANLLKNAKRDVLLPGDKAKFGAWFQIPATEGDMQFVPFQALFRDTFSESALMPVPLEAWNFDIDVAKTTEANK